MSLTWLLTNQMVDYEIDDSRTPYITSPFREAFLSLPWPRVYDYLRIMSKKQKQREYIHI